MHSLVLNDVETLTYDLRVITNFSNYTVRRKVIVECESPCDKYNNTYDMDGSE